MLLVILGIFLLLLLSYNLEGFYFFKESPYCDCYKKKNIDCINCTNCGICVKGKERYCVPGDHMGPIYQDDCDYWVNKNNTQTWKSLKDQPLVIARPWSYRYPNQKFNYFGEMRPIHKYPYPKDLATL